MPPATSGQEDGVRDVALRLNATGISCVPILPTGERKPAITWTAVRDGARPTPEQIQEWFKRPGLGVAVITGAVSGNLEALDIEQPQAFQRFCDIAAQQGLKPLLKRLVLVRTPGKGDAESRGWHLWYRCMAPVGPRTILAYSAPAEPGGQGKCLIETRGEGVLCMVPPSPGACHPSGRPYLLIRGDMAAPPLLSEEERAALRAAAMSATEWIKPERIHTRRPVPMSATGERPGDLFNARARWEDILEPAGWKFVRARGDGVSELRKPGKKGPGISATIGHGGSDLLYVFATGAAPFEPDTAYDKFGAWALLNTYGDVTLAATRLAAAGYCLPPRQAVAGQHAPVRRCAPSLPPAPPSHPDADPFSPAAPEHPDDRRGRRVRILTEDEQDQVPDPTWLIDGVLPDSGNACLYGDSGSGKSFLALDWALCVASGRAWYGHPVRQGSVLYMAPEGVSGIKSRRRAWKLHSGTPAVPGFLLAGEDLNLMDSEHTEALIRTLTDMDPRPCLIVWDTLARSMISGDENKAEHMGIVIGNCAAVQKRTGAAILIVHHTGVTGNRERGSSSLRCAMDAMFHLQDQGDGTRLLVCSKMKDAPEFVPFRLRLEEVSDSCCLVAASPDFAGLARLADRQRQVLEFLKLPMFRDGGCKSTEIRDAVDLRGGSFYRTINALIEQHYLRKGSERGEPYVITELGLQVLDWESSRAHPIATDEYEEVLP